MNTQTILEEWREEQKWLRRLGRREEPAPRTCDVPFCEKVSRPTPMFQNDNITCMRCKNFHCDDCSKQIWSGEWQGEVFYKPKMLIPGLKHEVFRCAFCRASFDRMEQV